MTDLKERIEAVRADLLSDNDYRSILLNHEDCKTLLYALGLVDGITPTLRAVAEDAYKRGRKKEKRVQQHERNQGRA